MHLANIAISSNQLVNSVAQGFYYVDQCRRNCKSVACLVQMRIKQESHTSGAQVLTEERQAFLSFYDN